ncbi:hypothetical protein C4J81_03310 [Deltaproteobacteria bacterium Smac51]|nr:hypothetical protein C4J81_03310 [Deltaproteobacteria bacterium Smac51]
MIFPRVSFMAVYKFSCPPTFRPKVRQWKSGKPPPGEMFLPGSVPGVVSHGAGQKHFSRRLPGRLSWGQVCLDEREPEVGV